jgi:hypothetical protein
LNRFFSEADGAVFKDIGNGALEDLQKLLVETGRSPAPELLRPAVCAIVETLKAAGEGPEEIRLAIRSVCRESGFVSGEYVSGIRRGGAYEVVDRLITACIDKSFV